MMRGTPYAAFTKADERGARFGDGTKQAYAILHVTYAVLPIVTGVDKFFDVLADWSVYVAPVVVQRSPIDVDALMHVAGGVEIAAGLLVAVRPRVGALVVAAWLVGIVADLALARAFGDVALRDLGLAAGALALGRFAAGRRRS